MPPMATNALMRVTSLSVTPASMSLLKDSRAPLSSVDKVCFAFFFFLEIQSGSDVINLISHTVQFSVCVVFVFLFLSVDKHDVGSEAGRTVLWRGGGAPCCNSITSQTGEPRGGTLEGASWQSIWQSAMGGGLPGGPYYSPMLPTMQAAQLVYNSIRSKCLHGPFLWNSFPFTYSQIGALHKGRRRDGVRQGWWPRGGCLGTAFSHSLWLLPRSTQGLDLSMSLSFPPGQRPRGSESTANAM